MQEDQLTELHVQDPNEAIQLLGISDGNMKVIEQELDIQIITRGESIRITGDPSKQKIGKQLIEQLLLVIRKGININQRDVSTAIEMSTNGTLEYFSELYDEEIARNVKGKSIRAKTIGQREYVQAIRHKDLKFCIGPAGTGKTYLAVVLATQALKNGHVKRIILTRPAVEAGESLGFLPGDLKEKVDPYLRPLYDALHEILGTEQTTRFIERGTIEIAPLAYMRGRTLDDAFVILDEAQNTTKAQMKMFLTRIGFGSRAVVTGDVTQVDLPRDKMSGLRHSVQLLKNVEGIGITQFVAADVVRHPLVKKIVDAYEKEDSI